MTTTNATTSSTNRLTNAASTRSAVTDDAQRPKDPEPSTILRRVFWVDRAIALTSGIALIALSPVFGSVLDWPTAVVVGLGAALLPYGAFLHWIVANQRQGAPTGKVTLGADIGWVAASIAVFANLSDDASAFAPWLVAGQALVIADIAIAKTIGFIRGRS